MRGSLARVALLTTLAMAGQARSAIAQATDPEAPPPNGFLIGGGIGFGTAGVHQDERGDSKPGVYFTGRFALARQARPFLVADLEWQAFDAPTLPAQATQAKTEYGSLAVLAGVAIYPAEDFYLMPRAGVQFRDWSGPDAAAYSETGFATGLDVGYHLPFGTGGFSISPEFFFRYSPIDGPDNPSGRALGVRVVAHWRL